MSKIASFFTNVYEQNAWGDDESRSGVGSSKAATARIRTDLPAMLRYLGVKSLLDAPCGDFNWISDLNLGDVHYIGFDIVDALIQKNRERFARSDREFVVGDLIKDKLPQADAIMCRDCMIHFSNDLILAALKNLARTDSEYLILTTYDRLAIWEPEGWANIDLAHDPELKVSQRYRQVNLRLAPFNLPPPLHLISEDRSSDFDKALGVWSTKAVREALKA